MKTKRLLALFLMLAMLIGIMPTAVFADDNPHASHSSYVYHVEAVDGNCTTPGNIEFWYCDYYTCEKCYSDEAMTVEISPADTIITPRVHSDACVNCGHTIATETFELFVPAEQPDYDEEDYFNYGFHTSFSDRLKGFKVLFVGEGSDGKLYAMSNVTNADGSRQAVELSSYLSEDGSVTVDSDTVEFFTYKVYANQETYTFSPDNGYMSAVDGKIVVRGQNIEDFRVGDINDPNDDIYEAFPPAIRFEQDNGKDDYDSTSGEGYLFSWSLDSGMIFFDPDEPAFVVTNWSSGEYTHSIMLYVERCEHENLIHTEGAELSCTQDGAIENWYCEDCQLYFADADASEYIELPENEDNYEDYLYTKTWGHSYGENCICENCGETCPHTNAFYEELENIEASCFEPGMSGYWYCEDCWYYLDENQENEYWESLPAAKIPATGHYFNTDTGVCDECGLANPVYTKVTSLDDINEEDLYIIVAEADGQYFVLGGLYDRHPDEQGNIWCPDGATNAIRVTANADGSISLVNQEVLDDGSPSEFMLDVNPEQFGDMSWLGLTTVMLKLPNHCVYPFQSYSYDNNGYMGVSRYATEYGMWDSSEWIIDFYTTVVTDDTYRYEDEFGSKTHAEQVADGNIDDNISEGNLLLYKASFYSVGGAMFTLRLREYNGQYYFICGEDWCLEGSDGWDYVTDTTPTNDIQYAVSLYRYDVPTVDAHTCEFINWTDNNDDTHTGTCECGKTETESHGWDNGVETKAPTCTEEGIKTYTCGDCGATKTEPIPKLDHTWDTGVETKAPTCTEDGVKTFTCTETNCGATKTEPIPALDHDWSEWTYDSVDSHIRHCKRENCNAEDFGGHEWGTWVSVDENTHKMTCSVCNGYQTDEHEFDNGVVTKEPTEWEEGVKTYTCGMCSHTKTEPIDKLVHECTWTDWYPNGDENHKRDCMDDNCDKFETLPHEWDNGEITKEPTCKETGVKTYTCQTCMYTRTEDVPTTDHIFGDWTPNNDGKTHSHFCSCNESETADHKFDDGEVTQAPTHEAVGEKKYTCSDCGYFYTEDIPALTEHEWGEWVINKLDEANTHIRFCICNESQTAPHNFDEGVVTTEATHTSKGVKTFTCDDCGYAYDEEIPTTPDHEWTDWSPNGDGTHTRACRCNANETKDCTYDDGVVTAPTCEKEGYTVYTCSVCDNTKTETKSALDHDWSDWSDTGNNAVADIHERSCKREGCDAKEIGNHEWSDWISIGSEEHKKICSICSGERKADHTWDNGEVIKEASTKETGTRRYTCADCGATKTEVISKIVCDHVWGKWSSDNDDTHIHYCENGNGCEAYQRQVHEWNEGVVTTEPTETSEGIRTYTCLVCGRTKTEAIAMLAHTHSFGRWVSDGEDTHTRRCENGDTCTASETEKHTCDTWTNNNDGTHSGKCSVCNAEMTEVHTWSDWSVGVTENQFIRSCICGASEEMTVQKPIEEAVVNNTNSENNGANANLVVDNAVDLFNSVLTDEEQSAIADGATVSIYLEVQDVPVNNVSSSDKAAAEEAIQDSNSGEATSEIGMYLDINLFKEVTSLDDSNNATNTETSKVTQTSNKVTITISIPDDLINTNDSVNRTYRIVRVHEDADGNLITDVIEGIFDPEHKTFTFETDKFSTYALAYNDEEVEKFTITYTDGVDGIEVFADQKYTVEKDSATPAFVGTPTRSGYTFAGWTPVVTGTVTANVVYKATWTAIVTPPPVHTHNYGTTWKTDETNHWYECSCGDKKDSAAHTGGTATCEAKAKCSVCNVEYGELATHTHGSEWKTDGTNHWHECSCGDKKDSAAHTGGTATCEDKAKCSVCNVEYGTLAEHKYSEATCTAKAKCSVCGNETGDLASHNYVDGKCECGETDPNYVAPHTHTFVDGKCECGETDPNYVAPHTHTFVEGKCECGVTDPNYVPETDYETVVPDTDAPETDKPEEPKEKGCKSSITGASVAFVLLAVISSVGIVLKKKDEE